MESEFYNFKSKSSSGKDIEMRDYSDKVVMIVNTASKCGFTSQYDELQRLYKTYKDEGLVILGFPCDQFAHQEPGTDEEIAQFCKLNFGVTFPLFTKVKVNGRDADPLYKYLRKALPGKLGNNVKWNFTKFLIDRSGKPVKRYSPKVSPMEFEDEIQALLK